VFHSPVAHRPYTGREALHAVLSAVSTVFEDFRYTGSYGSDDASGDGSGDGHVLRFAARVGDREIEGVDVLEAVDGRLTVLTVLVRPYSAATALRDRMAALLS
jgi:hypothetical protein